MSKHFVTIKHQIMIGQLSQGNEADDIIGAQPASPSVKSYFQTIKRRLQYVLDENNQLIQLTVSEQKSV
ncbi:MAG: hypothetical protein ACJA0N_001131 [Pseudohongiellaceae bacterium]|jgi:hypothetical protein